MFDRCPDPQLVTDLVAAQAWPEAESAEAAAVELIDQAMAWERVAAWVESQRLDTLRRFEEARVGADSALASGVEKSWAGRPPAERAALRRLKRGLETEAGRFAAEEIALALNISVTRAQQQLTLARDLQHVHRDLREALELGQVSGFVASMVAQATRKLPDAARVAIDEAVTSDAVEQPAGRAIAAARARVSEADDYAENAAARAFAERRVYLKPLDDGLALFGAVLPADDAMRAFTRCDDAARRARRAGAGDSLDQLRCDNFVDIMLRFPDPTVRSSAAGGQDDGQAPEHSSAAARPVSVSVVISLSSLLGAWIRGPDGSTATARSRRAQRSGSSRAVTLPCAGCSATRSPAPRWSPTRRATRLVPPSRMRSRVATDGAGFRSVRPASSTSTTSRLGPTPASRPATTFTVCASAPISPSTIPAGG
jgi:hypothetical protein